MNNVSDLKNALRQIEVLLSEDGHAPQAKIVCDLIVCIERLDPDIFNKMNSVEMWGGAGSVWEVEMSNVKQQKFNEQLLTILSIMEKNMVLGNRAKTVSKFLRRN